MRAWAFLWAMVGLTLVDPAGVLRGDPAKGTRPERIAGLVRQLGHDKFVKRQAASKELEAVGAPALDALGKAVHDDDPEVRWRAAKLIGRIGRRLERTHVQSVPPPKGAVVLFDGKSLDGWVGRDGEAEPSWKLFGGGVMEARRADIRTRQTFAGSYKLHVEFRIPANPENTIQGRGNSGVYLNGRYEIQILDSYGPQVKDPMAIHSTPVESCGAIYGQTAPRVNACKAPGFWQSYDIEFHPPRFKQGRKVANARVTVFQNGILIHDRVEIRTDDTGMALPGDPSRPGPVLLQYHLSPVGFRNIWLVPLAKR